MITDTIRQLCKEHDTSIFALVKAIYDFSKGHLDHELLNIARDGVISENELECFAYAMDKLRGITAAAIVLVSVPRDGTQRRKAQCRKSED